MHEAGDDLIVLEAMVEAMPRFLASSELTRLIFLASEAQAAKADAFPEALRRRLDQLDARFEELSDPGPFLGHDGEAGAYPEPRFPWLYRALRG